MTDLNPTQLTEKAILVGGSSDTLAGTNPHQKTTKLSLFDQAGNPVVLPTVSSAAGAPLTGLTSHAVGALGATDTVLVAFEKLEARILVLEAASADYETRISALEDA